MGWSAGQFGLVGDDPWDITGVWIEGVRATRGELASALQQVIDSTPSLVSDEYGVALWQVAGVETAPASARLIEDLRACARRVSASFDGEGGVGRKPTVPELISAFRCKQLDVRPDLRPQAIHDPRLDVRKALARDPLASEDVLAVLARDPHAAVSSVAAARLQRIERLREAKTVATPDRLLELARSANHEVVVALLDNPALPGDTHERLLDHVDPQVRVAIARHPRTPAAVIERIARDIKWMARNPGANVQEVLAENPRTPPEVLAKMVEHVTLRAGALGNPSTPADALERAAAGYLDNAARNRLARNRSAPAKVLQELARERNTYVRVGVATNPATPPAALEVLAADHDQYVRTMVAHHPHVPAGLLERLAYDREPEVVQAVSTNPNTPTFVLEVLTLHADPAIRASAATALGSHAPAAVERLRDDVTLGVGESADLGYKTPFAKRGLASGILFGVAVDVPRAATLCQLGHYSLSSNARYQLALYRDDGDQIVVLAETGARDEIAGHEAVPVASVNLDPGRYWLMGVFETAPGETAGVGVSTADEAVEYRYISPWTTEDNPFGSPLPAVLPTDAMRGQRIALNYYMVVTLR